MTSEHGYQFETNDDDDSNDDDDDEGDDHASDDSVCEGDDVNEAWKERFYCDCCKHSTLTFNGMVYHRSIKHGRASRLDEKDKFKR